MFKSELKFYSNEYGESSKLLFLKQISQGLKDIHRKNLVHRDFHSGNIIVGGSSCHIIDLGLAKPANETDDSKVFGVIPYVAPEVLQNKPYNPASDIYSLGIIMYELITCLPPYVEQAHDVDLVLKICQGERPSFSNPKTTQQEPNNRPTAKEVSRIVGEWFNEYGNLKTDTEFYHQYQAAEEFNKTIPEEIKYPTYQSQEQLAKLKLVEPQHGTKDLELDINNFNLDELTIQEDPQEQSSTQAQIEIPLNKTSVSIDNAKNLFELRNAVAKLEATNPPPATPADAELQKKGEIPFMAQPEVKDYKREVKELSFVPDYNKGEIRVEYVYGEPKKQAVNYTIQADKGERLQSIDPDNIQRPDGTEYYPMCPNITSYLADVETLIKDLEFEITEQVLNDNNIERLREEYNRFDYPETKEWINKGLTINGFGLAEQLQKNGLTARELIAFMENIDYDYNTKEQPFVGSLKLEEFTNLVKLVCSRHKLTNLDLSKCPNLVKLDCEKNQLTELDLSNCQQLESLNCESNELIELILPNSSTLKIIVCSDNKLTNLDLTQNKEIEILDIKSNNFSTRDLSF
ncbi:10718_t:CDS:2 [Entrophospora sp. SA101]|nr:10718_t:CDS:2 [Entrophospora sp. SA101]